MARQDITLIAIAFAIALALAIWGTSWLAPIMFGDFNDPQTKAGRPGATAGHRALRVKGVGIGKTVGVGTSVVQRVIAAT